MMSGGELSAERGEMQCWEVYYAKNIELFDEERERERDYILICLDLLCGYLSFLTTRTFSAISNFLLFHSVAIETNTWKWLYRGNLCELSAYLTMKPWKVYNLWAIYRRLYSESVVVDLVPTFPQARVQNDMLEKQCTQALQPEAITLQTLHTKYILIKCEEIRTSHRNTSTPLCYWLTLPLCIVTWKLIMHQIVIS